MSMDQETPKPDRSAVEDFSSTRLSVVLTAGQGSSPEAREALATLCESYWYPLYAYVRRRVRDVHEAQDLIQEFFARVLERNILATADPARGRFRSFLLTCVRHFLANEWDKIKAQKRGGGHSPISLDFASGESRYRLEPADPVTAERIFDREWAEALLLRVLGRLREEHVGAGKQEQFDVLKVFLTGRNARWSYAEAARRLGTSEGAAMVAAHRLRRQYRKLLRVEIAQTVSHPKEVDDEIRHLFAALSR